MRADRRGTRRLTHLRDAGGYSLVEMMVAIGIAAVVGLGIYAVFNYSQKSSLSQKIYNDTQTTCNFAMDQLKGELLLAGYRAPKYPDGKTYPISNAAANTITFEYYDDNARDEAPYAVGYDNNTRVTYSVDGGNNLLRSFVRHVPGGTYDAGNVTTQTLATNVASLAFTYFAGDNAAWNGVDPKDIRSIRSTLVCDATRVDPNTKKTPRVTLTAEVRARNVGVASTATDTTPPATPTGLLSWDPGSCGTLELRWNANTEADLEGYTIYYGLATGVYSERAVIARAPKTAGQYEYYTVTGIDSSVTGVTPQPRYYFAINAYDKSGNVSPGLSAEVSGNPVSSARTAAAAVASGSDTTVTPLVPAAPVSFAATPGNGSVTLSWTKSTATGLKGYRLYRSRTSAAFTPNDTPVTGNRIGNETALAGVTLLDQDAVSYTDTGLLGCTTYYYKLAAVACDTQVPTASLQFAATSGVPTDNERPPAPVIAARPGYRRIILTLTNPVRSGSGPGVTPVPDFSYTKIFWSKTGIPVLNDDGSVTPNQPIPRSSGPAMPNTPSPASGTFSLPGSLTGTINFNDEVSPTASAPNLQPDTTYYFRAVTYDLCGLSSTESTSSTAEGTQCGDCLLPAPAAPGSPDPACYGPPPDPSGVKAQGCYGYVDLIWDAIDDSVVRDFQGFRLQRREGDSWFGGNAATEVSLTGDDAAWLTTFRDASVEPGKSYSYRVMATDCYYEQHKGKSAAEWPEAGNDPNDNFSDAFIPNIAVGQVDQDYTRLRPVTGYLLASSTTAPFTESSADGLASVPPSFLHNTVTFWAKNTAASNLTLRQLTSSWENPQAYLQQFAFGDANTTPVTVGWKDTVVPLTHGSTGSALTLAANSRLSAGDLRIPLVTLYKNADGTANAETDQREQTVDYTLNWTNDSTATDGCGVTGSIYVPLGPYVYATSQDKPSAGTRSWPVPGSQGSNAMNVVVVDGGTNVNVFTNLYDSSGVGIAGAKLYYYVDAARTLTVAPAVAAAAQYPNLPPYTAIDLAPVAGSQWRTPQSPTDNRIPASDGSNVWFFIVAVDADGNFDREPEIAAGAFQYYQQPVDVCVTVPNAPALTGDVSGSNVILTWTPPATNTGGTAYTDGKGYKIYRAQDAGSFALLQTITDKNTLTWTDTSAGALLTSVYRYYVTAYDLCQPVAKESDPSSIYAEPAEGSCGNTPSPPVIGGGATSLPDQVTLTWTAPTTNAPPSAAPLTDLGGYEVWRRKNTEPWALIASLGAAALSYQDSTSSNIKNDIYSYYLKAFDTCSPTRNTSVPSNTYIEPVVNNPCDETPNAPTLAGSTTSTAVTLTWVPPGFNTNGEIFQDGGGYRVWRSRDGGAFALLATTNSSTLTYTDTPAGDLGTAVYAYRVTVFDVCSIPNESVPSNTYTDGYTWVDPCSTIPGPVTGLSATGSASGVSLSWSAPSPNPGDLDGYAIERRIGAGAWAALATSPFHPWATSRIDSVSDAGTVVYSYRVKALDSCAVPNYSPTWSNEAQENYTDNPCLSIPDVPLTPVLTAVTSSKCNNKNEDLSVTWTGAAPFSNATSTLFYRVYRCPTNNATEAPGSCTNQVYPATESPLPAQSDLSEMIGTGDLVPDNNRIWIWVEAVSAKSGCATTYWKTVKSAPVKDACGP